MNIVFVHGVFTTFEYMYRYRDSTGKVFREKKYLNVYNLSSKNNKQSLVIKIMIRWEQP